MNKRRVKALRMGIGALLIYQRENYGWSAKYSKEDKRKWLEFKEAIETLTEMRDEELGKVEGTK